MQIRKARIQANRVKIFANVELNAFSDSEMTLMVSINPLRRTVLPSKIAKNGLGSNFAQYLRQRYATEWLPLSDSALKGHYILAQGNALGENLTQSQP